MKKQLAYALAFFLIDVVSRTKIIFALKKGKDHKIKRENIDSDVGSKKTIALKKHTIKLFYFY